MLLGCDVHQPVTCINLTSVCLTAVIAVTLHALKSIAALHWVSEGVSLGATHP